jgi:prepilin-type N-terminal cleavage/methylation domain-containing protein
MLRTKTRGFTLVELAIVIAIAGLLFAGLYRLMAGGNTQLRDQAAADQTKALLDGIKNYLASSEGQIFLTKEADGITNRPESTTDGFDIALPPLEASPAGSPGCVGSYAAYHPNLAGLCSYLPVGFSGASKNPYSQTYAVRAKRIKGTAGSAPDAYEFMIVTSAAGGEEIPDASGGRIASLIGGDGGFAYKDTAVCTAAVDTSRACGSYGGWDLNISSDGNFGYEFGSSSGGVVATRTFVSASSFSGTTTWLARKPIPGQPAAPNPANYNTMQTALYMGSNAINMGGGSISMGGGVAAINMEGRPINMAGGIINMGTSATVGGAEINLSSGKINGPGDIILGKSDFSEEGTIEIYNKTNTGLAIESDGTSTTPVMAITGVGSATTFQAGSFIYSSDANLKKDITVINGALGKILQIKGVSYKWKDKDKADVGILAQDVEKVFPELIFKKSDGTLGVEYAHLIGPMIEALRELNDKNQALEKKIQDQQVLLDGLLRTRGTE